MAYNTDLAERIRDHLAPVPDVDERKMFGGLAFLVGGHMTVVASGRGGLMLRADPATTDELVDATAAELAEMRGRPMQGWLYLEAADVGDDELGGWIDRALAFSATLPPKN